jgi:hypothetical protein
VSRLGSPFIREVNRAIVGLVVLVIVSAGLHYVSVVHEMRRMRQELCATKLELLTTRNAFLRSAVGLSDTCAELTTLTGDPPPRPPSRRRAGV